MPWGEKSNCLNLCLLMTYCVEASEPRGLSGRGWCTLTPPLWACGSGLLPWSCEEQGDTLSSLPPMLRPTSHTCLMHYNIEWREQDTTTTKQQRQHRRCHQTGSSTFCNEYSIPLSSQSQMVSAWCLSLQDKHQASLHNMVLLLKHNNWHTCSSLLRSIFMKRHNKVQPVATYREKDKATILLSNAGIIF